MPILNIRYGLEHKILRLRTPSSSPAKSNRERVCRGFHACSSTVLHHRTLPSKVSLLRFFDSPRPDDKVGKELLMKKQPSDQRAAASSKQRQPNDQRRPANLKAAATEVRRTDKPPTKPIRFALPPRLPVIWFRLQSCRTTESVAAPYSYTAESVLTSQEHLKSFEKVYKELMRAMNAVSRNCSTKTPLKYWV
ncbi:hypothetical protein LWI28_018293 [Acer negundo]|uniref:Uncharacterized protein n=1 Tax=Acer negundo TaxID=4023 RepID=A0AAD5P3G5_ACENE|nr:hypothetical protein LWI28_018293 [Acer negundo]